MISLRAATPADSHLLRHWDDQTHVIASDPHDDWGWETELAQEFSWREQYIAELSDRPIGFLQIIDPALESTGYWGSVSPGFRAIDIWIGEQAELGQGYGTMMMKLALQRCFATQEVQAVLVDPLSSNVRAHRFYERLNFKFVEQRQFGEDDCFVYQLTRTNWQQVKWKQ